MAVNHKLKSSIISLAPSATLLINEKMKEQITQGKKVYRLGFGQSPFPVPNDVVQSLKDNAHQKDYLPVKGLQELRNIVAEHNRHFLGIDCTENDIMIGPGSKELILALQLVCDVDLILPNPSWVSYEPQAQIVQNKVTWVDTREEDRWLMSAERLEEACQINPGKPAILLLNYPSNPVGATYNYDQLKDLASVARKHQLLVIADEIYAGLNFRSDHISLARFYPEGTIISSGLSKWCGAGGWRLGTFCFPKEYHFVMEAMAVIASESFSAVSAPIQYAATTAFRYDMKTSDYIINTRKILSHIGNHTRQTLESLDITMPAPEGGFYLFPNFENYRKSFEQKGIMTSAELCETLLQSTGIAMLPGSAFGRPGHEYTCRLSYVDFDGENALKNISSLESDPGEFLRKYCSSIIEALDVLKLWLEEIRNHEPIAQH